MIPNDTKMIPNDTVKCVILVSVKVQLGINPPHTYNNTLGTKKAVSRLSFLVADFEKGADDIEINNKTTKIC